MYYVYVLISFEDGKFYIGFTKDLKRRYKEHIQGKVSSTRYRVNLKLVLYEAYNYKKDALSREKYLKSSDGKKELKIRLKEELLHG
jgi:putative endonuclease